MCRLDEGTRKTALADAAAKLEEAKALIPQTEAKLDEANSRLEEAKINFNAATKLSQGGYASETRVASAEAAMRSAEAGWPLQLQALKVPEHAFNLPKQASLLLKRKLKD